MVSPESQSIDFMKIILICWIVFCGVLLIAVWIKDLEDKQ